MAKQSPRLRFFIKTNAPCSSPSIRKDLDFYLRATLRESRHKTVRAHIRSCISCAAYVFNAKAIEEAQHSGRSLKRARRKSHKAARR
jgi:hypothetical protein